MESFSPSGIKAIDIYEGYIRKEKSGRIKIKAANSSQRIINGVLLSLMMGTVYGFLTFNYKNLDILQGIQDTLANTRTMFLEARLSHFPLTEAFHQVVITLGLAFMSTLIGAFIALFLSLFAARNLSNEHVSNVIKGFVAFIRAVPTVLWVLIFAVSAGLGSVAAIFGLTFHTVGYLIKGYSEAFEEIDEGVIEALKASGANWWQIVFQAVLPSSVTYLLAWTFMRFEINFTNAVAMGAAAGAGGIGFELFMAGNFYFDVREIGFITYLILLFSMILEASSTRLKNKYL
ncbi:MAG: ABC transporter permease subunit [Thermotaleaceae bacterium]